MRYISNEYTSIRIVNHVNDSPITHSISKSTGEFSGEPLDVIVTAWIGSKLIECAIKLSLQRRVCRLEESSGMGAEKDLKHDDISVEVFPQAYRRQNGIRDQRH